MVVLTAVIAWSVHQQAKSTRDIVKATRAADKRVRERETPEIRVVLLLCSVGLDPSFPGNSLSDIGKSKMFKGFNLTNASHVDVTITGFSMNLGIPVDSTSGMMETVQPGPMPVYSFQGKEVSGSFRRRLRYGEFIRVLFDVDTLIEEIGSGENDRIKRVQLNFYDSLGNEYVSGWTSWGKNSITNHDGPDPGFMTKEEWDSRRK